MTGTVIAITIVYYLFEWLLSLGSGLNQVFDNSYNLIAMLVAGIAGGIQLASTQGRGLRWPGRLLCALYGNIAIITAPALVSLFFYLPLSLLGFGFSGLLALPSMAAMLSINWVIAFLVTFLLAIPTIFVGFTFGQWIQFRRMQR